MGVNLVNFGTAQMTIHPSFQCRSGVVGLFRFVIAPRPGTVIGTITAMDGSQTPLIQTQTTAGVLPDGQFATLCGPLVRMGDQVVLDVRVVNPGAPLQLQ